MINTATDLLVREVNPDLRIFRPIGNDTAPTANAIATSRCLTVIQAIIMIGSVASIIVINDEKKQCESKFPEIKLPPNVTQSLIDEFDYRNDLRHNCEKQKEDERFYTAIAFIASLFIVNLAQRTSCLYNIGSLSARILPYFRRSNREGIGLQNPSGSNREMQNLTPVFNRSVPETIHRLRDNPTNIQTGERPAVTISTSPQATFPNIPNAPHLIATQPNSRSV